MRLAKVVIRLALRIFLHNERRTKIRLHQSFLPDLRQCGDVFQAKFVSLAEHTVHEQAEDTEDGVKAHV